MTDKLHNTEKKTKTQLNLSQNEREIIVGKVH